MVALDLKLIILNNEYLNKTFMNVLLVKDIFNHIGTFLNFKDLTNFHAINKNTPILKINYTTYLNKTKYIDKNNNTYIETSYILSSNNKRCTSLRRQGFIEIYLNRGDTIYNFYIYENIFKEDKNVLYYLKNIHNYNHQKFIHEK